MTDQEPKKAKLVNLLAGATPPAPKRVPRSRAPKPATAAGGNVINIHGDGLSAQQIAGGDIHNHVNEKTVVRPQIVRGPEFISPSGARRIKGRIETLVKMDIAAGEPEENKSKLYAKWWSALNKHFDVASYLEIRADQEQQAADWLQTLKVLKRPSLRRTDNAMWRNEHYAGIWSRAKQVKKSKADVYQVVLERLGKRVASLKNLGEQDLKALHSYIMGNWVVPKA